MFTCGRLVDQATQENDLPAPGAVLAESVQLCRKDANNVNRIVTKTMDKLQKPSVMIRLKALRYLLHLTQNGPPSVQNELRLYSAQISQCMNWRGLPHPTRQWEPYQEMNDVAQSLLDLVFAAPAQPTITAAVQLPPQGGSAGINRSANISYMESYSSNYVYNQSASLEPRNLGPQKDVGQEILGFFKKTFKIEDKPQQTYGSTYGSVSNTGGYQPGMVSVAPQYRPPPANPMPGQYQPTDYNQPPQMQQQQVMPTYAPPPARGQFQNLQQDPTWANKKVLDAPQAKQTTTSNSAAAKLLKVTGNRALPTNGELTAFRNAIEAEHIDELVAGLDNQDWKVRVRAIAGLDIAGEKFTYGAVSNVKDKVAKLLTAPQASLKGAASKFYAKIKDVEYTGIPEAPSAFDFGAAEGEAEAVVAQDEVIDFGAGEEQKEEDAEEPKEENAEEEEKKE